MSLGRRIPWLGAAARAVSAAASGSARGEARGPARGAVCALLVAASLTVGATGATGCNGKALEGGGDAGPPPGGLTPEQASQVVARVGGQAITLGDFAAALERMDQFDRLRYQTKERRRELLGEIVDLELLAQEARRRGLDKQPEVEEAVRQVLRDAALAKARDQVPAPAEIPAAEVRAYYEANQDKFIEPERRRVAAIVLADEAEAQKVLEAAKNAPSAQAWGELVQKHSITAGVRKGPTDPTELQGDLGIVGPPGDAKGGNARVLPPVRAAVFKLAKAGAVGPEVISADGKFWVIRLMGITPPHARTLADSDRAIRVAIIQQKIEEREKAYEAELRKKYKVEIDEKVLSEVKVPAIPDATSGASGKWRDAPSQGKAPEGAADAGP